MTIEYKIRYVPDEMLGGRDFVMCNEHENGVTLVLRRGVRAMSDEDNAAVWEEAWAAFRELAHVQDIPPQRMYVG